MFLHPGSLLSIPFSSCPSKLGPPTPSRPTPPPTTTTTTPFKNSRGRGGLRQAKGKPPPASPLPSPLQECP